MVMEFKVANFSQFLNSVIAVQSYKCINTFLGSYIYMMCLWGLLSYFDWTRTLNMVLWFSLNLKPVESYKQTRYPEKFKQKKMYWRLILFIWILKLSDKLVTTIIFTIILLYSACIYSKFKFKSGQICVATL